jgi:hypothetical protein
MAAGYTGIIWRGDSGPVAYPSSATGKRHAVTVGFKRPEKIISIIIGLASPHDNAVTAFRRRPTSHNRLRVLGFCPFPGFVA